MFKYPSNFTIQIVFGDRKEFKDELKKSVETTKFKTTVGEIKP